MNTDEIRAYLRLSRLELSSKKATALLQHFKTPAAIFDASDSELKKAANITDKVLEKIHSPEHPSITTDIIKMEEMGVSLITLSAPDYPLNLKQIYDAPPMLYVRGSMNETDRFSIAMVGSRSASVYGKAVAERIARDLANRGLTVVSGGARGVDTAAHKGALALGGRTIAILGCGVDVAYPPENKALFSSIIGGGGAIVSEFPMGTTPEPWRFPARNRLISGISTGVLVVESPEESGALITANYAGEQGREVFAVPGNVDNPKNRGCHRLIKEGAKLVETADDILEELNISHTDQPQLPLSFDGLTCVERKLVELLSLQPKHMDQIIQETGLAAHEAAGQLTLLEMRGLVKRVPGNAYIRAI